MKLEDIELQLGDKLTLDNGTIEYVNFECGPLEVKSTNILKIERLIEYEGRFEGQAEDYSRISGYMCRFFVWNTIWERKEKPTNDDIEELYLSEQDSTIICETEYDGTSEVEKKLIRRTDYLNKKLNEVIKKVNNGGQ